MDPGSSPRPGRAAPKPNARGGPGLRVTIAEPRWLSAVRGLEPRARRAFAAAARAGRLDAPVSLLLADDAALARLNARHRGKPRPTNVLSFPNPAGGGDLALALGTVRREARALGRSLADHLAHLVVHGTLHLAGFDHATERSARVMERREAMVLRRLGVPDPYRTRR